MIETSGNSNDKIFGYHPVTPTIRACSIIKIQHGADLTGF